MALQTKLNTSLIRLRDTISASDGQTVTTTETWTGPYNQLLLKAQAEWAGAKNLNLTPTEAGHGQLTITRATGPGNPDTPPPDVLELIWAELRLPVATCSAFDTISAQRKKEIKALAEDDAATAPENELEAKLYNLLAAGTTEYAIGAPVVRRTRALRTAPGGGGAWIRESPPALAPSGYQWLKTANETRKEGNTYTHTEEWTGAKTWDETLYPVS